MDLLPGDVGAARVRRKHDAWLGQPPASHAPGETA